MCIMYTMYMKSNIQFKVTKQDSVYTASAIEYAIVTQATTLEELFKNIEESVLLYSEDESDFFDKKPSITIQYDF
jgi:predicted RNase H-like HicB family nuclease